MARLRRACMTCGAEAYRREAMCVRGHSTEPGWYVMADGVVIGLGHERLPGYLTFGPALEGYRLLGSLHTAQLVVDLEGRVYATKGIREGTGDVPCVRRATSRRVMLKPWMPVRVVPALASVVRAILRGAAA